MAANYGVNVTIGAEAARGVKISSITPIGIAGYEPCLDEGIYFYMTTSAALEDLNKKFKEKSSTETDLKRGSIFRAIKAIDSQAVETQIILSVFEKNDNEDTSDEIASCVLAIEQFKVAKSKTGYAPDLIIAPEFSGEDAIKAAIEARANSLGATGIIDIKANSASEAITKIKTFGTKRLIALWPRVRVFDTQMQDYVFAPQSSYIAGLIARVDASSEFGYSDSYSNRVVAGIVGTEYDVDFVLGETCTADELRVNGISTIINESGFRSWGGETTDQDAIWQDLARVRVFDRISRACQQGVLYAVDKKASELYHAKRSVEELLRSLIGAKVLLGFEVSWSEKNTLANITAGKFYLDVRMQNNPIVKQLTLDFYYVDNYGKVLMDKIK